MILGLASAKINDSLHDGLQLGFCFLSLAFCNELEADATNSEVQRVPSCTWKDRGPDLAVSTQPLPFAPWHLPLRCSRQRLNFGIRQDLLPLSRVTSGKSLHLSEPHFPHSSN